MAHDNQSTWFPELFQLLSKCGFDGMAEGVKILMKRSDEARARRAARHKAA